MPALPHVFLTTPIAHRGYHDRAAGRIENSRAAVAAAVAAGELTPSEAAELGKLVECFVRALEVMDIDQRLRELETQGT